MENNVLADALKKLGKAASERKHLLKKHSLTRTEEAYIAKKIEITEEDYIKQEVGATVEEYIDRSIGASADDYLAKVLPEIPAEKPTDAKVKNPSNKNLLVSVGIFAALLVAGVVLFFVSISNSALATVAGVVCIAAIVSFFNAKKKYKDWKAEKEKYDAEQLQIAENIKFNNNRTILITEREEKIPVALAEYQTKLTSARDDYSQKVDTSRNEYLKKVAAARAEYKHKIQAIADALAPYDKVIETYGYLLPEEYYIFAEYIGGSIALGHADNIEDAVKKMFEENPDWRKLLVLQDMD